MDFHTEAERLAKRPYLIKTSVDTTTEGQPIIFAQVLELDGCFGQGETREAAIEDLRLATVDFIESLLQDGLPVPDPTRLSSTFGTATQGSYTFVKVGQKLQQKPIEANQEAYILAAQAN